MFNNLISGNQYIFTRKRLNEDDTETFYATFYDIISTTTLRVTDVYDQSMNLQCDMRTLPVEWIVSIDPFDNPTIQTLNNQSNSTELDDDIETIVLDDVKPTNKKTPQFKDAFY